MSDLCTNWNGAHDCGRPADHPGDHECPGCHDVWNQDPFDAEDCVDPFFVAQRDIEWPEPERCVNEESR